MVGRHPDGNGTPDVTHPAKFTAIVVLPVPSGIMPSTRPRRDTAASATAAPTTHGLSLLASLRLHAQASPAGACADTHIGELTMTKLITPETNTSSNNLGLPPPLDIELSDGDRVVGWLTDDALGFRGFADEVEAVHASWVASRALARGAR